MNQITRITFAFLKRKKKKKLRFPLLIQTQQLLEIAQGLNRKRGGKINKKINTIKLSIFIVHPQAKNIKCLDSSKKELLMTSMDVL